MKFLSLFLSLLAFVNGFPRPEFQSRIIGGKPAERNEIPFQAVVLVQFGSCDATILNANHVVTTAYCVTGNFPIQAVRVGDYNTAEDDGTEQVVEPSDIFVHPDYDHLGIDKLNDIAIVRLATPLKFNEAVQPIALPPPGHIASGEALSSGWGRHEEGSESDILRKVGIPIIDDESCAALLNDEEFNGTTMICAGALGFGFCAGDLGGPLVAYDNGTYLAGIANWYNGCGGAIPNVYTEVMPYVDWINSIIN